MSAGDDPQSLDKEYVRRWLKDVGYGGDGPPPPIDADVRVEASRRYIEACERVSGATFVPNTEAPTERIRTNLNARVSS